METKKIFSDSLTEEQYDKLTRLAYVRKPDSPEEINTSINFNELHESIRSIVSNLPIVEFKTSFFDDILNGDQQFYLMTYKDKVYLVNTEGYTYARYVIQLKDLVVLEKAETQLMKAHPGSVETVIDILNHMEVDGETMEYILDKTNMKEQMLRQLIMTHTPFYQIQDFLSERIQANLPESWKIGNLNDED